MTKLATPTALAFAMLAAPAQAQGVQAAGSDAFNLPEDVTFISGNNNPNVRRATARVNGNIITGTDIDQRLALIMSTQGEVEYSEAQLQELRLQVLRNLIDETLQVQEASIQDMAVTNEEVDSAYENFAVNGRGMTVPELDAYLTSIGSSPRSIKRQIMGELAWDRLLQRNIYPFVSVSAEEVREVHERIVEATGTTEYRLGEIFLSANPTNRDQVAANAQQIVQQLRQGGSFVAYARQYSEASTRIVGGDLGWIRLEQLQQPTLEAAAQQMTPGQLVGPLEIPGGFSILLMIDQRQIGMADPRDAVLSLKQISIGFEPGMTPEAAEARAAEFIEVVNSMSGCGDANQRAAAIGAQVVDNDQIPVRQLPEALQTPLLQLSLGQTTPPFGDLTEGVRVLMLCGRDDPEQTSGPTIAEIENSIESDRVNRRAQRYLRDLRRDAVIEYN
ncbi:peptidylprolyl isomerase [Aurantiacibacter gangjinensis]|uniref:peptidylprolyl isomerase n=1 Tax=Aurantiacibacter gangjinensis TaxID=502682 RepID=UPI001EEE653F|nr:peptidylprolyl isomerase [Aurantiacibacter gangjinensis]